jgi:hypothetical protein
MTYRPRAVVFHLFSEHVDTGWGKFDRSATLGDAKQYPSRAEVASFMREVSPGQPVYALNEEQLNRSASLEIPGFQTLTYEPTFFDS